MKKCKMNYFHFFKQIQRNNKNTLTKKLQINHTIKTTNLYHIDFKEEVNEI